MMRELDSLGAECGGVKLFRKRSKRMGQAEGIYQCVVLNSLAMS